MSLQSPVDFRHSVKAVHELFEMKVTAIRVIPGSSDVESRTVDVHVKAVSYDEAVKLAKQKAKLGHSSGTRKIREEQGWKDYKVTS